MLEAFPKALEKDVLLVMQLISKRTYGNVQPAEWFMMYDYRLEKDFVKIPYRVYYLDNSSSFINNLSLTQQMIVHCLFTRSCNGFLRQQHLRALLQMDFKEWALPFIVKVCDEYVIEIVEMAYEMLKARDCKDLQQFCALNRAATISSYDRMTSYWDAYYRVQYSNLKEYPGVQLFKNCFGYPKAQSIESNRRKIQ